MNKFEKFSDRIYGGLVMAGIGDALGAPTEQWTIDEILAHFGNGLVSQFYCPTPDTFAGANGGKVAEITDDASQMYYLAHALVDCGGKLTNEKWISCLLDWVENSPKAGFMGPSTEALVKSLQQGDDFSRFGVIGNSDRKMTNIGTTNGAAMRVAPVGMCFPGDIERTAKIVLNTCLPSHDTDIAIEAATAIACATSVAMVSDNFESVIVACQEGGRIGRQLAHSHGRIVAGPRFKTRVDAALRIARSHTNDIEFLRHLEAEVGNSVLAAESVPAAIGIFAYAKGHPQKTVELAATIGNDSDSIAAMAGAMAGSLNGTAAIPPHLFDQFIQANTDFDLQKLSREIANIAAGT